MRRERRRTKREQKFRAYQARRVYENKLAASMEAALRAPRPMGPVFVDFETTPLQSRTASGRDTTQSLPRAEATGRLVDSFTPRAEPVLIESLIQGNYTEIEYRILAHSRMGTGLGIHTLTEASLKRTDESSQEKALRQVLSELVLEEGQACSRHGAGPCRAVIESREDFKLRRARRLGTLLPLVEVAQCHLRDAADPGGPERESGRVWDHIQNRTASALKNFL